MNKMPLSHKERAKMGAEERWNPRIPKSTHSGVIKIAGQEIACDVLSDGRRVLRQKTFLNAMGRGKIGGREKKWEGETNLPVFLSANNLTAYLGLDIQARGGLINYKGVNGQKLKGYDATILPESCKAYVRAQDDGKLQENQISIAKVCRSMLYGLATIGIISLVDDATGFVEQRNRNELEEILKNYISEELRPWTKKFPDEFFKQIYRLHGWEYPKKTNHPQYVGKIINEHIYSKLPPCVLDELKKINPLNEKGVRSYRHHQFLTGEIGNDNLQKQIMQVISIMKVSDDIKEFKKLISKIDQLEFL